MPPADGSPKPSPLRFAVIGVDHPHAIELTAHLREAGADCVGWAHTTGGEELFAAFFADLPHRGARDLLAERPELVVVAAVPHDRARWAVAAMHAGADVLVDKPGAVDHEQIAAVADASASTGRRWWVAFTEHLTSRAVIRAHEVVASGRIGTVRHLVGLGPHRRGHDRPSWFTDPARSGPLVVDLAGHQFHHAATFLGSTDLRVVAARRTPAPDGTHPDLLAEVLVEGGSGSAYLRVDWLTPDGLPTWGDVRLFVTGDRGTIEVRANIDVEGAPGADHLLVVDADGTERIDCSHDPLTWAARLADDVRHGTETVVTTGHCLAVSGLAIDAAELAARR